MTSRCTFKFHTWHICSGSVAIVLRDCITLHSVQQTSFSSDSARTLCCEGILVNRRSKRSRSLPNKSVGKQANEARYRWLNKSPRFTPGASRTQPHVSKRAANILTSCWSPSARTTRDRVHVTTKQHKMQFFFGLRKPFKTCSLHWIETCDSFLTTVTDTQRNFFFAYLQQKSSGFFFQLHSSRRTQPNTKKPKGK